MVSIWSRNCDRLIKWATTEGSKGEKEQKRGMGGIYTYTLDHNDFVIISDLH